jgi:6-phosphofructokinase 1
MKRVSVLTSGGDAPGMNAAVRAVVRAGIDKGWSMFGVRCGYTGLISGDFVPLGLRDVGGIIQQGGTVLGSSRCDEFKTEAGRAKALAALERQTIKALIVIGGDGSQTGAYHLSENEYPVVGIASTIDNDLYGSEISIGVDTALNVALESIDRLKVTAASHRRAFIIEVMGRNCGYLALVAGITGGAEVIVIPEVEISPDQIACEFRQGYERGKRHAIAVVAEGAHYNGDAFSTFFEPMRKGWALNCV